MTEHCADREKIELSIYRGSGVSLETVQWRTVGERVGVLTREQEKIVGIRRGGAGAQEVINRARPEESPGEAGQITPEIEKDRCIRMEGCCVKGCRAGTVRNTESVERSR